MSINFGPTVTQNGLIFSYDMYNTKKSYLGKPTTNFFINGHFAGGTGMPQESGSNATNTVISFPDNPGDSQWVLEQTAGTPYTEYQINLSSELVSNTTYVMSGWYGESPDYSCADGSRMFHARTFSASGNHIATGIDIGTVIETRFVGGIRWRYCYMTISTPSDYSNIFNWYVGYGNNNYTGKRYYTNLQMEVGTYPSRFVNGTRSTSQAVLDLTNYNIWTANNLTYSNDGTFSFNGSNSSITSSTSSVFDSQAVTMESWNKPNSTVYQNGFLFEKGQVNTQYSNFYNSDGTFYFRTMSLSPQDLTFFAPTYIAPGGWYHIVCTVGSGLKTIYVNGIQITQTSYTGTLPTGQTNQYVGIYGGGGYPFNGQIAVSRVYNRALTAAEVTQNFNADRGRFGR